MLRGQRIRCATVSGTDSEKWRQLYGTTATYNLPQHKKHAHEGHCWATCPYDDDCDSSRTAAMTRYYLDPYYDPDTHYMTITGTVSFVEGDKIKHETDVNDVVRHYYMKTESKGPRWGYECTYSGCPYEVHNAKPYFYI